MKLVHRIPRLPALVVLAVLVLLIRLYSRGVESLFRAAAPAATRLDLNRATADELTLLPGIGPRRARAIVADRERRGPFASVDALLRVRDIGPATLDAVRQHVVTGLTTSDR